VGNQDKVICARKNWVEALITKDLEIDEKGLNDAMKKAVVMNDLAHHHLMMSCMDKAFIMSRLHKIWKEENGDTRKE